jgi:glycosyltransferase involved in cell wall biosynthesis
MNVENKTFFLISQVFFPDEVSTAALFTDLCVTLANEHNYDVRVWCAQPSYTTLKRQPRKLKYKDVNISYIQSTNFSKNSIFGRLVNYFTFSVFLFFKLLFDRDSSPVFTVTNPPFLGIILYLAKKLRNKKYIYIIHDIYPDGLVLLGKLSDSSLITKIWRFFNRKVLRNAEKIIVIGRDMEALIVKSDSSLKEKIVYIPNWQNALFIDNSKFVENDFLMENDIAESFVVQYSGNMGIWHDMRSIALAAKALNNGIIKFCFIGDGKSKKEMYEAWNDDVPSNVKFFPFQPKENLTQSLTACHVALISLREGLEGIAVPCKLYGILASGRAIIAQVPLNSEIAAVVGEENCGVVVAPGKVEDLIDAIKYLEKNPSVCRLMGENARKAFEQKYTTDIISQKYIKIAEDRV